MSEIRSKAEFFRLWEDGRLGNKLRTWRDPVAAWESGVPLVGFRELGKAGGGKFEMAKRSEITRIASAWSICGRQFMICEAAPDEKGTLQGEVCRTTKGLEGFLGLSNGLRMRDAIAQGKLTPRTPLVTRLLLERYMCPNSLEDLEILLERYPDATVEFTCYSRFVGEAPRRNTVFWEVRNY